MIKHRKNEEHQKHSKVNPATQTSNHTRFQAIKGKVYCSINCSNVFAKMDIPLQLKFA